MHRSWYYLCPATPASSTKDVDARVCTCTGPGNTFAVEFLCRDIGDLGVVQHMLGHSDSEHDREDTTATTT